MTATGLRERKKARTRRALFEAALRSFTERGYDQTTIADLAAEADVSPRTFFSYYPSKEHVVFYEAEERAAIALRVIAERHDREPPVELLVRAVREVLGAFHEEIPDSAAKQRMRLVETVPALKAYQLRLLDDAERRLSAALFGVCSDELTELDARIAAAVTMSAVSVATRYALEAEQSADARRSTTDHAIALALRGLSSIGSNRRGDLG